MGSATSADLAGRQSDLVGSREPQFDALSPDTTVVTLGIGGNDIGLIELGASRVNPLPEPVVGLSGDAAGSQGREWHSGPTNPIRGAVGHRTVQASASTLARPRCG